MEDQEQEEGQLQGNSEMDQVLLLCKKIEIQHRLFCFEFKENCLAQYLIVSHNGSSILIPSNGISCFFDTIDCLFSSGFFNKGDAEGFSKEKEVKIDDKVFCFGIGKKRWGHYMKVWEPAASQNNTSSIIIPSGNNGWELFKTTLAEIYKTSRLICPPRQRQCGPAESSADAKVDSITSESAQNSSESMSNVEPSQSSEDNIGKSRMMRAGLKRFYFDLEINKRSRFLKISDVMGANRSSIKIPLSSMQQFHEMVGRFLKYGNESLTSKDLKHSSSLHIRESKDLVVGVVKEHSASGQDN